jgi:hypothetical protein
MVGTTGFEPVTLCSQIGATRSTSIIENMPSKQRMVANWSQTPNGACCIRLEPATHEFVQARPVSQ